MVPLWMLGALALIGCEQVGEECARGWQFDVWDDGDGDGAGDPATGRAVCELSPGEVTNGDDCDDGDPAISPYTIEICDGADQDCDGAIDDGLAVGVWYGDRDGDGEGDPEAPVEGCSQPAETTLAATDCDDGDPTVFTAAPEVCDGRDNTCDGAADDADPALDRSTGLWFYDDMDNDGAGADASGFQACQNPDPSVYLDVGGDCDDANPRIFPGQIEVCDRDDNNCDGLVDDDDPLLDPTSTQTVYRDLDFDGLGEDDQPVEVCFLEAGVSAVIGDCDDLDPTIGLAPLWYVDGDGDGFAGSVPVGPPSCSVPLPGALQAGGPLDCADADGSVYPGAPEVCDGADNDCDNLTDDADPSVNLADGANFYRDIDGDGFGAGAATVACANPNPAQYSAVAGDCLDGDAQSFPGGDEVCDTADNDCDLLVDEADPTLDLSTLATFYEDLDNDGTGDWAFPVEACAAGDGLAATGGDCNDADPAVVAPVFWVTDADGDGVGAGPALGPQSCDAPQADAIPETADEDCLDFDPNVYPGALEVCDGVDSDCDGVDCADWREDFELGPPLSLDFRSGGNALWIVDGSTSHLGNYSGRNGNIGDNQESFVSVELDYALGGTISFWHGGSTEANYDFLVFTVDGTQRLSISGTWGWTFAQYAVPAGVHTLEWTYDKDASVSAGSDSVWIDDVEALGASL